MKQKTDEDEYEVLVFKSFSIKVKNSEKFVDALDRLCKKFAIAKDEYQFRYDVQG